jgi:hypothetical protein
MFVCFAEWTAIVSLHNSMWLVLVTKTCASLFERERERSIGLWDVEASTFCRQSIHIRFRGFRLTQHCFNSSINFHLKMVVRPKHVAVNLIKIVNNYWNRVALEFDLIHATGCKHRSLRLLTQVKGQSCYFPMYTFPPEDGRTTEECSG